MALTVIPRGEMHPEDLPKFHKFSCPPNTSGNEVDLIFPPDVTFDLSLIDTFDLDLPDGGQVRMWVIRDRDDDTEEGRNFPSKTLRIPQGALVHATVNASGGPHTIHWHGIEGSPMNDGVGKLSFEVSGSFIYQFQPRDAGTYFYHCHVNTPLHFEMGLYGFMIIDPPDPAEPERMQTYPTGGPGFAAMFNPDAVARTDHAVRYDVEALWALDSIDSEWHSLGHMAFVQDCDDDDPVHPDTFTQDGILNDFRPDIFVWTGIPRRFNDLRPFTAADHPLFGPVVAPTVGVGQTLLVRVASSDYVMHEITLGIDAEVIAMDGRALGMPPFEQYSRPFALPANTPFLHSSAMRWDLLIRPTAPGEYPATVRFLDPITGRLLYTAQTAITVTG